MDDAALVGLYWARDERAIPATAEKYGAYCAAIARNILPDPQDAEECVSDAYLQAWNAIPPHRPAVFSAFLGKLTRNLALNRLRQNTAQKRGGGEAAPVFEEVAELLAGSDTAEDAALRRELLSAIDAFLAALSPRDRSLFVCRYWYFDSVGDIARRLHMTENLVSVSLHRLRQKLRHHLSERGLMP